MCARGCILLCVFSLVHLYTGTMHLWKFTHIIHNHTHVVICVVHSLPWRHACDIAFLIPCTLTYYLKITRYLYLKITRDLNSTSILHCTLMFHTNACYIACFFPYYLNITWTLRVALKSLCMTLSLNNPQQNLSLHFHFTPTLHCTLTLSLHYTVP